MLSTWYVFPSAAVVANFATTAATTRIVFIYDISLKIPWSADNQLAGLLQILRRNLVLQSPGDG